MDSLNELKTFRQKPIAVAEIFTLARVILENNSSILFDSIHLNRLAAQPNTVSENMGDGLT